MVDRSLAKVSLLAAVLLGAALAAASAHAAKGCRVMPGGPVSLLILESAERVQRFAAGVSGPEVLKRDDTTVIFDDGRVVTADVDSATLFLNELGWGNLQIQIVASFPKAAARPRAVG